MDFIDEQPREYGGGFPPDLRAWGPNNLIGLPQLGLKPTAELRFQLTYGLNHSPYGLKCEVP